MTKDEALKLALEFIENSECGTADLEARIKKALAQPEQEPVAWSDLKKEAQQIVESKFLWKKFIDGTPLSNDIACWMADFAQQYTIPPQRSESSGKPSAWVGLTADELNMIGESMRTWNSFVITDVYFAIAAKLKQKNGYAEENT